MVYTAGSQHQRQGRGKEWLIFFSLAVHPATRWREVAQQSLNSESPPPNLGKVTLQEFSLITLS